MMPGTSLILRIQKAHERCKRGSLEAVHAAVECGVLLIQLREETKNGDWNLTLQTIGLGRQTCWNYMRLAEKWDARKNLLKDGIYFCNLLRESEFQLLPELQGGGRRLGKEELERRQRMDQLVFHFDSFTRGIEEVARFDGQNPFAGISAEELSPVRDNVEKTLQLIDEALKKDVEV